MSLERRAKSVRLVSSNPVVWWWGLLSLVSIANIAVWFLLCRLLLGPWAIASAATPVSTHWVSWLPAGSPDKFAVEVMLFLCAAYVFGCAFRSFLPRADVQRICLFDTWLSSVMVGRSVATVAEMCFAAQWALVLYQLGKLAGADTTLTVAWMVVPLILVAECFSWHAVLTRNYLFNAIENSIWAITFFMVAIGLCRLLPEFQGLVRLVLVLTIVGIAGYLAFLATVDVPMYLSRWRADGADRGRPLPSLQDFRDVSIRWVVTRDIAEWKDEIVWMTLYFSAAVWASLVLCVFYAFMVR